MSRKFLISIAIITSFIFSFSVCFAADGLQKAADDVRNVVGGVENTVENAAMGVSNTSKNVTGSMENGLSSGTTRNTSNSGYSTTRVSTGDTGIMGMSSNTWTWLILGIAAIAIIAVVWYYSMQFTNNGNNRHDDND